MFKIASMMIAGAAGAAHEDGHAHTDPVALCKAQCGKGPETKTKEIEDCEGKCDAYKSALSYKQNTCETHAESEMEDKSICTHDLLDCQTKAMAENAGKYHSGQIDYKAQEAANNANLGVCFQKEQEKAAIAKCQKTAPNGKACLCSTAFLKCGIENFKMDAEAKAEEKRVNDLCEKAHPCAAPAPANKAQDGSNAPVAGSILAGAIAAAAYMV